MNNKKIGVGLLAFLPILTLLITPSCKKYADPPPYFEDTIAVVKQPLRKVLIIGVDGAVGTEYKAMQLPVLVGLQEHSKYSWEAVSDESTTDAASWKTLMTGISYSRHAIHDSSFIYTQPAGGAAHGTVNSYPSFFSYILSSSKPDIKTTVISQFSNLLTRLVPEVEDKVLVSSDAAVKDSAVARVKRANAELVVVNFNSVAIAGLTHGFSATAPGYKSAALTVDGYIGEIMTALKTRPEYNKDEEWLVVLTGTHGGVGNAYGGGSKQEVSVFSFYYNEKFKSLELYKPPFINAQLKGGKGTGFRAVLNDPNLYNPGTGPMTIEMKVKGTRSGGYPLFFSKKGPATGNMLDSGDPGFLFFTGGNNNFNIEARGTTGRARPGAGPAVIFNNDWHTISTVFVDSLPNRRWMKMYVDGIKGSETEITSWGSITSAQPLILGYSEGNAGDAATAHIIFNVADVRIFNVGLSSAEVAANVCSKDITQHPRYTNLIGYWPCNDGIGGRFRNYAPGYENKDFIFQNSFLWESLTQVPCSSPETFDPAKKYLVLSSSGVANNVFYWLRIPTASSWGFEGSSWLSQYEIEFVKL